MRKFFTYLGRMFSDQNGNPLARRYACALFGITAIVLAFLNYDIELVGGICCSSIWRKHNQHI